MRSCWLRSACPRGARKRSGAIREFAGASGPGYYYSATDRAPKPGEFTYLTQGMMRVDELVVTFTILSNAGADALLNDTLGMLKSAAQVPK